MTSVRHQLYPTLRAIAQQAPTLDVLLRQMLGLLASAHQAEGVLWVENQPTPTGVGRAYATAAAHRCCDLGNGLPKFFQEEGSDRPAVEKSQIPSPLDGAEAIELPPIRRFRPQALPQWLEQQQRSPHVTLLASGDLIIPILSFSDRFNDPPTSAQLVHGVKAGRAAPPSPSLQFVLQLHRPHVQPDQSASQTANNPSARPTQSWSAVEVASLEAMAGQIPLLWDRVRLRQALTQSQRHAALARQVSHLLNSVLPPDDVVRRILAELGQAVRCDRCLIIDLRHDDANLISCWDRPRQPLRPLDLAGPSPALWRDAVDLVLQGAASYLELNLAAEAQAWAAKGVQAQIQPTPQIPGAIAPDMASDEPQYRSLEDWLAACGARSALMVPIFIQEDFFGMLVLLSHRAERAYPLDELQMTGQMADQVAIALKAARHYSASAAAQRHRLKRPHSLPPIGDTEDRLTRLLTRPSLEQEVEYLSTKAMQATHEPFSVVLCDLDYFKLVNDTYGAVVGDEVLKQLAKKMQRSLRRGTSLYRYGGEEFAVLLPETVLPEAVSVAERLRQLIRSQAVPTPVGGLEVTVSFGVAQQTVPHDGRGEDVLRRAEMALANAKRRGRDRVEASLPADV